SLSFSTGFVTEGSASESLVVSLKGTTVLPCTGTDYKGIAADQQHFRWTSRSQLVAQWSQGQFTAGPGYNGRVQFTKEGIKDGNFFVTISPVEYNDRGLYDCFTEFEHLAAVTLEVLETEMSALVGDPVTLPCYASVSKQTDDSELNIHWAKDGETVLRIQSGSLTAGSGFENRVNVSLDSVRLGDLSLTLSMVHLSDKGAYRCIFKGDTGTPKGTILTVAGRQSNVTIQASESLLLPLYTREPVHVLFSSGGSTSVSVCSVEGDALDCGPQYQHRASVQNSTLMVKYIKFRDSGVYKVMDHRTRDIISTVVVTVTPAPRSGLFMVFMVSILGLQLSVLTLLITAWCWLKMTRRRKLKLRLLVLLVLLTILGLVQLALSATMIVKPGLKDLDLPLGVGLGLFMPLQMVFISMKMQTIRRVTKFLLGQQLSQKDRLKLMLLVLLVFLVLLGLSVAMTVMPGLKWLNLALAVGLCLFMFFPVMLMYMILKKFMQIMGLILDKDINLCARLYLVLVLPVVLLWFLDLVLSGLLAMTALWEGVPLGLAVGLTVGMGLILIILVTQCWLLSRQKKLTHRTIFFHKKSISK
ncbi:uncharacterized protein LOC108927180, partial [Arapaima gigas]